MKETKKVVFLDRDGVINIDKNYLYKWDDFEFISGSIEGMKKLINANYQIIIVTNQSGIARGFYSENEYLELTAKYNEVLKNNGINVLDIFYCPHFKGGIIKKYAIDCECRKPKPGMILKAIKKYEINITKSILIGDKESDIIAGRSSGLSKTFLISSNKNKKNLSTLADKTFSNLNKTVDYYLSSLQI